jgi:hypothetical protein
LLVRFDIPTLAADVSAKRAAVNQANARLELAKAAIARVTPLVAQGVAARREVDEARREQLDAEANLAQAESALTAAQSLSARATVRANFAGVVSKRWHNVGDQVGDRCDPSPASSIRHLQVPGCRADRRSHAHQNGHPRTLSVRRRRGESARIVALGAVTPARDG